MNLELQADRDQAETVACPSCTAPIGTTCIRLDGRPLEQLPAHPKRLAAAGVLHAPLDSRELARDDQLGRSR